MVFIGDFMNVKPDVSMRPSPPPWLRAMLSGRYFELCEAHAAHPHCDQKYFCMDCCSEPLCASCTESHVGHKLVQMRKSSYHDAVRVADVARLLDLSGVQPYVINGARIVFLRPRPHPRVARTVEHVCVVCSRGLLDDCRYCSLGCKLEDSLDGDDSIPLLLLPADGSPAASGSISPRARLGISPASAGPKKKLHAVGGGVKKDGGSAPSSLAAGGLERGVQRMSLHGAVRAAVSPPHVASRHLQQQELQMAMDRSCAASLRSTSHPRKALPHRSPVS